MCHLSTTSTIILKMIGTTQYVICPRPFKTNIQRRQIRKCVYNQDDIIRLLRLKPWQITVRKIKSGLYDPSELRCSFGSGFHTDSERSVWIKTDVGEWTCDPWCVERGGISTAALKQSSFSAEAFVRLLPSWDTRHLWPIELRWHKNKCIFPRLSTQSEGVVYC